MDFTEAMENLTELIEAVGVAIIVLGETYGLLRVLQNREAGVSYYVEARRRFGQPLLLGLEVLVAADIIARSLSTRAWRASSRWAFSCSFGFSSASPSISRSTACCPGAE